MSDYIQNFTPDPDLVPPHVWAVIQGYAIAYAMEGGPDNKGEGKYLMSALAQLLAFCLEHAIDLESPTAVFSKSNIDRFIRTLRERLKDRSRSNYRSALTRVAAKVNPHWGNSRSERLTGDTAAEPYPPTEFTQVHNWAELQPPGVRSHNAKAIVGCCAGGGLTTNDLRFTLGTDVVRLPDAAVDIRTRGARPRIVPILREYAGAVLAAAERAGDGYLFRPEWKSRSINVVTDAVSQCVPSDAPRVSTRRLRANWIVWHFEHRTPLRALEDAAGASADSLTRYLRHCTPVATDEAARFLRGDAA